MQPLQDHLSELQKLGFLFFNEPNLRRTLESIYDLNIKFGNLNESTKGLETGIIN